MIVDGHTHVILPVEEHLALMDAAGVDMSILCMTRVLGGTMLELLEGRRHISNGRS
jgi:hypothetical protein